jgi:Xaa-Pro aminopeptidase
MRDKGASGVAYNSIIGGGDNATILHYVETICRSRTAI